MDAATNSVGSNERTPESSDPIDRSDYVYNISQSILDSVCYLMDEDNLWEKAAKEMGYSDTDIIVSCRIFDYHKNMYAVRMQIRSKKKKTFKCVIAIILIFLIRSFVEIL